MAQRLIVEIVGDASSLNRTFRQVEGQTRTFGQRMKRVAGVGVFAGATVGVAGFTAALKSGFSELAESQKVAAQTAAALKSTGRTAGVTGREIEQLARSVQRYSGADDEAVQAAQNLLLTFTRIQNQIGEGNDIFNQTTRAVVDLSQAFDQDLSTSAIQLGKALNDPERGLTALRRIGISFTDAQVKLITRLNDTGRTLEAQKLILAEVNRQVGGSARAFGQTLPGQLKIAQGNIQNVTGAIAEQLSPQIEKLLGRFNRWIENEENVNRLTETSAALFRDAAAAAEELGNWIGFLAGKYMELRGAIQDTNSWFEKHGLGFLNKGAVDWGIWDRFQVRAPWNALPGGGRPGRTTVRSAASPDTLDPRGPGRTRVSMLPGFAGNLRIPGAGATAAGRTGATAAQRNAWFDAMIGRMLGRVSDATSLRAQITKLREIAGLIQQRLTVTKDITRRLNLEDQLLDIAADIRSRQQMIADEAKAAQVAKLDERFGWLTFAAERAEATKRVSDDLKAYRDIEAFLKDRIKREGRTLELVRELWQWREKIRDLNKQKSEQITPGVGAVGGRKVTEMLAAGLNLGDAAYGRLAANVAGAKLTAVTVDNQIVMDGQVVARSTNRANTRAAHRTARQTSGFRD